MTGPARASLLVALALAAAGCVSGGAAPAGAPLAPEAVASAKGAWSRHREAAFAPRRFKALFRGEAIPKVGPVARGYVSVFWDGRSLDWRLSAPVAGGVRSGRVSLGDARPMSGLLPGRVEGPDVIGVVFGVLDRDAGGATASGEREGVRLDFGGGRSALVDPAGQVVEIGLPGGVVARITPGAGVPRRVRLHGPDGTADLTLQSFGPWDEGEPAPPAAG